MWSFLLESWAKQLLIDSDSCSEYLLSSWLLQYSTIFTDFAFRMKYINIMFSFSESVALSITYTAFSKSPCCDLEGSSVFLHTVKKLGVWTVLHAQYSTFPHISKYVSQSTKKQNYTHTHTHTYRSYLFLKIKFLWFLLWSPLCNLAYHNTLKTSVWVSKSRWPLFQNLTVMFNWLLTA